MGAIDSTAGRGSAGEGTVYVAVEVSRKSWVVGVHAPDLGGGVGLHRLPAADVAGLAALIGRARKTLEGRGPGTHPRVLCAYEAGYEGFWLARRLGQLGIETLVIDAASLPVSRRGKRVKTDRVDAARMVRALAAFDRGEPFACTAVRIPSVEEEDRKRLLRERRRLVKQRTMLTNSVKGLLMLHGVFGLAPRAKGFPERLEAARTGYGTPLPPGIRAEVRRTHVLLGAVEAQIAEVERERDRIVARARGSEPAAEENGGPPPDPMIARLAGLKGIGPNDATLLAREVFCREFRNRRQLASWAGLAPAPWASGATAREQGIDKAGPAWVRAQLVQMAWRWLRHQPDSALSAWYRTRTGTEAGRARRVFITALTRKLLVALWRYATGGLAPEGAKLA